MEIEEALSTLEAGLLPLEESEICPLAKALGRVTSHDIYAPYNVPPFPKSAMDGYALRHSDSAEATKEHPVILPVRGKLFAGDWTEQEAQGGTAVRVMTGSYIPKGYDCVVRQEDTDYGEERVKIFSPAKKYQNYCAVGEDIKKGSLILKKGTRITPLHIGLLASMGLDSLQVFRPLRVSLLATGSELMEAGKPLQKGKIYASISPLIEAKLSMLPVQLVRSEIVEDDEALIQEKIESSALDSDILITTGGLSVGKKDYIPAALARLGAKILFSKVNIQPGTPTTAALLKKTLLLSLSGNPYAALVNFDIYFYHALSAFFRCQSFLPQRKKAILQSAYTKKNRMRRFVRAFYGDGKVFLPVQVHASSVIANLLECNCYIDFPTESEAKEGSLVTVLMMQGSFQ